MGEHVAMEVRQVDDAMLVKRLSRTAKLPGDENVVLVQYSPAKEHCCGAPTP